MPPRQGSVRVRTGCRTCKSRRIKCDEAKPYCRRCTSTGRLCASYEDSTDSALAWYRPRQLTARDEREGRAFQYFSHNVGPVLAGYMDGYFWTHLVMQFSHFNPAVRHAVIAVSSLYENFDNGSRIMRPNDGNLFPLKHYNAAIQQIKSAMDEQLILVVSILFMCIECLQGDFESSLKHCHHGIVILSKASCSPWARDYLLPIFQRLAQIPPMAGGKVPSAGNTFGTVGCTVPSQFESLRHAQATLDDILTKASGLTDRADESRRHLIGTALEEWHRGAVDLESSDCCSDPSDLIWMLGMRMKYYKTRISLRVGFHDPELDYDEYLPDFRSMVSTARSAAHLIRSSTPYLQPPSFTFEAGFLVLLLFVVHRCRCLETRVEALSLMPVVSAPKESLVDVGTLYRVGWRIIEIEHGIALEQHLGLWADSEPGPAVGEWRVVGIPIDHDVEMLVGPDGAVSYRRTVRFKLQSTKGGAKMEKAEYITDRSLPVVHSAFAVVPDMRRAWSAGSKCASSRQSGTMAGHSCGQIPTR